LLSRYPVLVHCTQGKDRTGLIVALLLLLLEVPLEAVTHDYHLSETELLPERESRLAEMKEMGFTEDFALAPMNWMPKLVDHLNTEYGGLKEYLHSIGFEQESQLRLVEILSG
jgi:protein-tyrosine phosphatase